MRINAIRGVAMSQHKIVRLVLLDISSVEDRPKKDAHHGDEDGDGDGGGQAADPRQSALVNIKPVRFPLYKVYKLCVQPLSVKVIYRILEWILITLLAHTLITASLETSSLDWHTLKGKW